MARKVLAQLMLPYRMNGRAVILLESRPVAAEKDGDRVTSVTVERVGSGDRTVLTGPFFLDATETGELPPTTGPSTGRVRNPVERRASPTRQRWPIDGVSALAKVIEPRLSLAGTGAYAISHTGSQNTPSTHPGG